MLDGPTELERHQRLAQALYVALTYDEWIRVSESASADLTPRETYCAAAALIASMNTYDAYELLRSFRTAVGAPANVAFETPMKDARHWAEMANRDELKCYAMACWESMEQRDRDAFLKKVSK